MSLYAPGSLVGKYVPSSPRDMTKANYVIANEYAYREEGAGLGIVNEALAKFVVRDFSHLRIYAARRIAIAINRIAPHVELAGVFEGPSSNTLNSEGGTWGELQQAIDFVGNKVAIPVIVAQSRHAPRVAKQAIKMGLDPLLPPNLPEIFDPESVQWWCRGPHVWPVRELIGAVVLRHRKQL